MIKRILALIKQMGWRYVLFRAVYEFKRKSGILALFYPVKVKIKQFISLDQFRKTPSVIGWEDRHQIGIPKKKTRQLTTRFEQIRNNQFQFFHGPIMDLSDQEDWVTNPQTHYRYDNSKHWTAIPDYDPKKGDIKYVWEKSRFTYFQTIIRYDYHFEEDHASWVFSEMDSWITSNPVNCGPNYRCSQEMSIRLMNWSLVLSFYKDSNELTEQRWSRYQHVIYWHLHHIYHHIHFSRVAVRNNHALTETLMLALSVYLFPFIPETQKWSLKGRKWFEKEVLYQVAEDGSYIQYSMNYHRVAIQLFTFAIWISRRAGKLFSRSVDQQAYLALNFLYQFHQPENGHLPNYGANDGSLLFDFSDSDFRDYRPQMNTLHLMLTGKPIAGEGVWKEEAYWFKVKEPKDFDPITLKMKAFSFDIGGYYGYRTPDYFLFIRCGDHPNRPSQADNLHVDLWVKGVNVLRDVGSFGYTDKDRLYFSGTSGHNTVTIEEADQMKKGGRFIWYGWTQKVAADWMIEDHHIQFTGIIHAFNHLGKKIYHKRRIRMNMATKKWVFEDVVTGISPNRMIQCWHLPPDSGIQFGVDNELLRIHQSHGWYSPTYGMKEPGLDVQITGKTTTITTILTLE